MSEGFIMTVRIRLILPTLVLCLIATAAVSQETATEIKKPDVVFVPTPQPVVDKMLELAEVDAKDLVYDLGCGNGIIIVSAAKLGAQAIGFDVDPLRIKETQENIDRSNVGDHAQVMQKDIFTLDLSKANVVTLYLLPSLNEKLIPQLKKLKPGSKIVSHDFAMAGVKPKKVVTLGPTADDGIVIDGLDRQHTVYLWEAPIEVAGEQK
jgi:SAM-dependent methyltransferase